MTNRLHASITWLAVLVVCVVGVGFIWKDAIFYLIVIGVLLLVALIPFGVNVLNLSVSFPTFEPFIPLISRRVKAFRRKRSDKRMLPGLPPPPPSP